MRFIWWYADACFCPVCRYIVPFHHLLLLLLLPAWYCWVFRCCFFVAPVDFIFVSYFVIPKGFVASVAKVTSSTCQHKRNIHIIISIITQCVNRAKKGCFRNKNINVSVKYRNKNTNTNTQIDTDTMENIGIFIKINTITLTYLCGLQHQFSFSIRTFGHIDTGWWVYIILFFCFNILWLGESPWAKFNMHEIQ